MEQFSQLAQLGLFDARVPRYTSYPPAPHFSPAIGAGHAVDWIRAIPVGSQVSLYVHIPFCRRLCWFCACRTQGTVTTAPVESYIATLLQEVALLKSLAPRGLTLSRLHFGGGTPTIAPAPLLKRLASTILEAFPLAPGGEFSVEIDPTEIDAARMDALAQSGLTRASIGVQDFDQQIQQMIGREQSFEVTARAVDLIRTRGIASLNADILFGLPGQTPDKISETVQQLLALSPDRVALYGYAHVPWVARRQVMIPAERLPDPRARLDLFTTAASLFRLDGYDEIGIDHFARPGDGLAVAQRNGRLRRNFQGYTDDGSDVLIGLGASSISHYPQGYAQNAPLTAAYLAAIREGRLSAVKGHAFSAEDKWRARMIEALMCDFEIRAEEFTSRFDLSPAALAQVLAPVAARFGDMVELGPKGLRIPPHARPLTRMIAQMFDAYDGAMAGHSTAI